MFFKKVIEHCLLDQSIEILLLLLLYYYCWCCYYAGFRLFETCNEEIYDMKIKERIDESKSAPNNIIIQLSNRNRIV